MTNMIRTFWMVALVTGLLACQASDTTESPDLPSADGQDTSSASTEDRTDGEDRADAVVLKEVWQSPFKESDNVDSPAFWQGEVDGTTTSWVLATGKESHDLLVYDGDSGELVRRVGSEGDSPGQFQRPNGATVLGDHIFVVERDNRRVQVLTLPGFETEAMIGLDVLRRPYGLTLFESAPGTIELYVTDNYETADGEIPPAAELGERVKHFRVTLGDPSDGALSSGLVRSFGDTEGSGVLTKVETLLADPGAGRLLIADEHENGMVLKVYDFDGQFTGEVVGQGHFFHEAEGLALRTCGDGGFWISTDQAPDTSLFRVFDRQGFTYRGTFRGELTANTDGVVHTSVTSSVFPRGAFFAVHDDQGVTAFDWRDVAKALDLPEDC